MSDVLLVQPAGKLTVLTLNRPEQRNALNTELRDALTAALGDIERDDSVSVAVLAANGPVFCAGFDLKEFRDRPMQEVFAGESSRRYHERLRTFSKPLVGAINGAAMAGGFDLAAFCDVRVAAPTATFGHPEIRFGAGVMYGPLADLVGMARASELAFTGNPVDAETALRYGLVARVVPPERLLDEARALAETIAEAPAAALRALKRSVIERRA